ncbi:hypothetical protein AVEN_69967-1 [Araneus ventricosus]|uniref:DUF5641 domain-containing protein n=1 Tax=Araneus ventricosus TaxID=182803 RepID=A0A4Y2T2I2_ARAVE|nr:hypothetical protein AVEN_69967-1 [Araneus ventricosus]
MVELARTGFLSPANQKKKEAANKLYNYPTAATLVSTNIRNNTGTTKLLGILWDLDKDVLKCRVCVEDLKIDSNITKRFILAAVQRIFDPLGILCSATLPPKILLQNTWKLKLSWDSTLPDDIVKPFLKWWGEVVKLSDIEIPRHLEINDTTRKCTFLLMPAKRHMQLVYFLEHTLPKV